MKSFSKRVASFAMAAAMVFSLVAVSPADAEAASRYSLSKKSSITAGKTYTYKVKGVSKNQYIKVKMSSGVTVKYGSKKVKYNSTKITGGKTLALKVKAADKVANYKATLKAIVYNKKTNKRVKGLTTTTTVKCTKLAIKSVEPATLVGSNGYKYIVVNFNKALSKLDASEVSIRDKNTNELISIENVKLATNGKSATLTMLGDTATSNNMFVWANTDYVLTVSVKGATAAMDFNFPDVRDNRVVTATDAAKRTITVSGVKYTVPTTINVDFQEILGRTVTFWFNKNNEITKLNVAKETVVYGAFASKYENGVYTLSSKTSDDKYTTVSGNNAVNGTIYNTAYIAAAGKNFVMLPSNADVAYAKLVLNPNGTIRAAVYETSMANQVLVSSVAGNVITESKTVSTNLKDFTIIRDGKTISIADIQVGDVVFYNTTDKFAEVYKQTVTGAVTNVTDTKVTIAGTTYEYASPKYVEGNESKDADPKYFSALKAAAKDATVYLNRFGKVIYASGDKGAVATTTREVIVKGDTKAYVLGLESYIKLNASDATDVAVPEIKLSELKKIKTSAGTWTKDDEKDTTKLKSIDAFKTKGGTGSDKDNLTTISVTGDKTTVAPINFVPAKGDVVTLTVDSKDTNKVVGIELTTETTTVSTNAAFEKGKTAIDGYTGKYQILSSTPVFEITKDAASVTKTTYGEYSKKTKKENNYKINLFVKDSSITKVVIDNSGNDMYDDVDTTTVTGVVTVRDTLDKKTVNLTVVSEGTEKNFTSFKDDAVKAVVADAGQIVEITYEKATNKVTKINVKKFDVTKEYTKKADAVSTNGISGGKINGEELAGSIAPTITVYDAATKSVKVITYGELSDLAATTDYDHGKKLEVKYHYLVTGIIDYVVVEVK